MPKALGRDYEHVWALIRFDEYTSSTDPNLFVTVKFVTHDRAFADAEAVRLNELNSEKGCHYFVSVTRLLRPVDE